MIYIYIYTAVYYYNSIAGPQPTTLLIDDLDNNNITLIVKTASDKPLLGEPSTYEDIQN